MLRVHREGWPFIALAVAGTVALFAWAEPLGWLGLVVSAWCVWFFRDPDRVTPPRDGLIVSPADGVVLAHVSAAPPEELGMGDGPRTRVSIFMNIFNVHVNRIPCNGTVAGLAYRPGRFINASFDKASEHNERMSARIRMAGGGEIAVVQIAGLIARRIKCRLQDGQSVRVGERYGIIRFGSRLDVYLPDGVDPLVVPGQIALAGETVLADLGAREPQREGDIR